MRESEVRLQDASDELAERERARDLARAVSAQTRTRAQQREDEEGRSSAQWEEGGYRSGEDGDAYGGHDGDADTASGRFSLPSAFVAAELGEGYRPLPEERRETEEEEDLR